MRSSLLFSSLSLYHSELYIDLQDGLYAIFLNSVLFVEILIEQFEYFIAAHDSTERVEVLGRN